MILHHFHVHERGTGPVGNGKPVAGADQGVGTRLEDAPHAAGGHDDGLRLDERELSGLQFKRRDSRTTSFVILDQRRDEPFLEHRQTGFQNLLIQHVQHGLAGKIRHKKRPCPFLATEAAGAQPPVLVSIKDDPHVFQGEDVRARFPGQNFHGILVTQIIAAFDRLEGVLFPLIPTVGKRRVNAALSRVGMAANRMHLRDDRDGHPGFTCRQRGPHPGQAGPHHEHVKFVRSPHGSNSVAHRLSTLSNVLKSSSYLAARCTSETSNRPVN